MQCVVDRVVRLPDGRSMGYAQYGSDGGFPIVNAHGGLACRLDVAAANTVAAEADVRLISPDRPGIGLSDPQPGRTVLDWANDVADLFDRIDVDRFAVMGWSMGGQYAAAVGHAMPHRVTRLAIIAGALPLTDPGVFDELPTMDWVLTGMSRRAPWLAAHSGSGSCGSQQVPRPHCTDDWPRASWGRLTARSSAMKASTRSPGCPAKPYGNRPAPSKSIGHGCGRGVSLPRTSRCQSTSGRGPTTN
ncbi:MAG TPA: alpha/beta hydrolase [Mycobacterium sp.]|nr:alpha/beta hydrolase [Mycobacterium sp.]